MIDPNYRAWMGGSNNPLDPKAPLNSNAKIHKRWDSDYAALLKSIADEKRRKHEDTLRETNTQEARDKEILDVSSPPPRIVLVRTLGMPLTSGRCGRTIWNISVR